MRRIIHLDMDAFYASVEQRDRPELRGLPVIVGGSRERGVVCACSYESRPFGVRSGMAMARALRLCPKATVLPVRMGRYKEVSMEVFGVFARYTDRIEPLSIDEGFLDVTGSERLFGPARGIAERIRTEVRQVTGLAVSAGIAHNKFLAKLASQLCKPDGLLEILPEEVDELLIPLPVSRIWGVGEVTARQLESLGIRTIGDVRTLSREHLSQVCGSLGEQLYRLARGEDDRPVETGGEVKSMGAEETFEQDLWRRADLERELLALAERVCRRLRRRGLRGRGITLKVKFADFTLVSRSRSLSEGINGTLEVFRQAQALLGKTEAGRKGVRLLGISLTHLEGFEAAQPELFGVEERGKREALDRAVDRLWERYGEKGVRRGTLLRAQDPEDEKEV